MAPVLAWPYGSASRAWVRVLDTIHGNELNVIKVYKSIPGEVLEELQRKDLFVYLGHGERARQLLRHEKLQVPRAPQLRSILVLLGCSSVKLPVAGGFGMASAALLGGAPLVLGAQWDVLGGDLDKLASRQGVATTSKWML